MPPSAAGANLASAAKRAQAQSLGHAGVVASVLTVLPVRNLQGGPGFNFTERHAGVSLVLARCGPDTGSLNTNLNELPV